MVLTRFDIWLPKQVSATFQVNFTVNKVNKTIRNHFQTMITMSILDINYRPTDPRAIHLFRY